MNARKLTLGLAVLAVSAATVTVASFVGCGGTANVGPDASTHDSASGMDGTTKDGGGPGKEGGGQDTGIPDTGLPDTGSCVSDSGSCNTCYTDAQAAADPLNGCSTYTKNCVSFAASRVPSHPTL
jgi:hypothetical protein